MKSVSVLEIRQPLKAEIDAIALHYNNICKADQKRR
jgi:hypothetical protein